jgi:DNA (cytosine-5)-methyltransferase 1
MRSRRAPEVVSETMRRVKSRDTRAEVLLRRALWARGLRFRLHRGGLPGKPDIVFAGPRVVVFVDGDFWHGRQWVTRGHSSLSEQFESVHASDYWVPKITRTVHRDIGQTSELLREGWRVVRFWESEVLSHLDDCVETVIAAVRGKKKAYVRSRPGELRFAEFFAGIGLVRLALQASGWRAVFANDIDAQKREMYQQNFTADPPGHYVLADIHSLRGEHVSTVSLATASFPCTDLSLAGRRLGLEGQQSGTLWPFLRIVGEMGRRKPPLILLENVPGLLSSHGGRDLKRALLRLNELGYECDAFMMDAAWFVPQSRLRLFIVGVQEGVGPLAVSDQLAFYQSRLRPPELADRIFTWSEVAWRVRGLPDPIPVKQHISGILEAIPEESPIWWSRERVQYLMAQMSERHRAVLGQMMAAPTPQYGTVFRRMRHGRSMAELRTDGIAGCLRTPRGGSSRQILVRAGRGECRARYMTPREYARLQGVPDGYRIDVPMNQAFFGFGDAVCVPVIQWVAEHYLNPLVLELLRGAVLEPVASRSYA